MKSGVVVDNQLRDMYDEGEQFEEEEANMQEVSE
jgi:hypothetical protein